MSTIKRGAAFTAADLATATFPPPRWAVPDLLAEGVNLLVGAPKLGKSWLAFCIAIGIASGGRALGSIPVEEGDVLYLALEDTPRRLQRRMEVLLDGAPAPERLTFLTDWPGTDEGWEFVEQWLTEAPNPRAVIVDVLHKVRSDAGADRNAYASDYAAMAPMMALSRRHDVCFLVVHHTRKAAADDFLDTVSGTNGIAGAADATLVLARSRNTADATLSVTGRDVEERSYALAFHSGQWALLDGTASDYELSGVRRQVIETLRQAGVSMTPKSLSNAMPHDYEATKKLCARMAIAGQLLTDGTGRYSLPPDPLSLESLESPSEGQGGPEGQVLEFPPTPKGP